MIKKITTKFISILVCAMMVSVTPPINMFGSSVYAKGQKPTVKNKTEENEQDAMPPSQHEDIGSNGESSLKAGNLAELQEKIEQAKDGDTIKLTGQIEVTNDRGYALIVKNKKITITSDANAQKIICKGCGSLLKIEGQNSQVTLENVEIDGMKVIKAIGLIYVNEGVLTLGKEAKIFNCEIIGYSEYYDEKEEEDKKKEDKKEDDKKEDEKKEDEKKEDEEEEFVEISGAIYCKKGTVNIDGGTISNCNTGNNGGAIHCLQGTVNMKCGQISKCSALGGPEDWVYFRGCTDGGGAIFCKEGKIFMSGGKISECKAFCPYNPDHDERGRSFIECEAGGAIICRHGIMEMTGGEISECYASGYGGAISCSDAGIIILKAGTIKDCKVQCYCSSWGFRSLPPPSGRGSAIYLDEECSLFVPDKNLEGPFYLIRHATDKQSAWTCEPGFDNYYNGIFAADGSNMYVNDFDKAAECLKKFDENNKNENN